MWLAGRWDVGGERMGVTGEAIERGSARKDRPNGGQVLGEENENVRLGRY